MVSNRLTSFVLGFLFFMHALTNSSASVHQGNQEWNTNELEELIARTIHTRKLGLGGKKNMAAQKASRIEIEDEAKMTNKAETSKISGKDSDALKNSPERMQVQINKQKQINMKEAKTSESTSFVIPRSNPENSPGANSKDSQDSKTLSATASSGSFSSSRPTNNKQVSQQELHHGMSTQKDENQRLLEATKEIVNLMHKDYKGMARRKPPINNHEPWH
ncbi:Exocyst complex component like [Quillaja saponaria]|uniref:Exocyst complex component like n=1 Tax=Quillaja saponaria TaxID=32244 RepID=A0AAD7Q3T2_QUISA|nr:Exocyst complex component like [Quillaja saponaria]